MKTSLKTFIPGYTQHILQEEITRQRKIQTSSPRVTNDTLHANESERVLTHLSEISVLEEAIVRLSAEATAKVLSDQSIEDIRQLTTLGREGLDVDIGKSWSWLQEALQMCEIHLQNASNYHQFQLCLEETQQLVNSDKHRENLSAILPPLNSDPFYLIQSSDLQEHLNHLLFLWRRLDRAVQLAHQVVPIQLRIQPLKEPCAGIWLGSPFTWLDKGIQLCMNEPILVVHNSDKLVWRVQIRKTGQTADLPAIGCMIIGPDLEAIAHVNKLRGTLSELWRMSATEIWKNIYQMFHLTLLQLCEKEMTVNEARRKRFLALLQEFHNKYARKMVLPGDAWFEMYDFCVELLSNNVEVRGDYSLKSLNDTDITEMEQVLKCFRNFIREYSQLKKNMKHHVQEDLVREMEFVSSKGDSSFPKLTRFPSISSTGSEFLNFYERKSFQMSHHLDQHQTISSSWSHHFYDYRLRNLAPPTLRVSRFHCYIPDYGGDTFLSTTYHSNCELQIAVPDVAKENFIVCKEIQLAPQATRTFSYVNKIEISPVLEEGREVADKPCQCVPLGGQHTGSQTTDIKQPVRSTAAQTDEVHRQQQAAQTDKVTTPLLDIQTKSNSLPRKKSVISSEAQTDPTIKKSRVVQTEDRVSKSGAVQTDEIIWPLFDNAAQFDSASKSKQAQTDEVAPSLLDTQSKFELLAANSVEAQTDPIFRKARHVQTESRFLESVEVQTDEGQWRLYDNESGFEPFMTSDEAQTENLPLPLRDIQSKCDSSTPRPWLHSVETQTGSSMQPSSSSTDSQTEPLKYVQTGADSLHKCVNAAAQTDPIVIAPPPTVKTDNITQTELIHQKNQETQSTQATPLVRAVSNYTKTWGLGVCQVGNSLPDLAHVTTQTELDKTREQFVSRGEVKSKNKSAQTEEKALVRTTSQYMQPRSDIGLLAGEQPPICVTNSTQCDKIVGQSRGTQENLRPPTRTLGFVTDTPKRRDNFTVMSDLRTQNHESIQTDPIPPPPPIECREFTSQADCEVEITSVMLLRSGQVQSVNVTQNTGKMIP